MRRSLVLFGGGHNHDAMRIIRFVDENGRTLHGEDLGDGTAAIFDGSILHRFRPSTQRVRVRKVLAPILPPNIICVGRNYPPAASGDAPREPAAGAATRANRTPAKEDHTLEVFLKPTTALQNPNDVIIVPAFAGNGDERGTPLDPQIDCEGELAVIIGREARNVSESRAHDFILGYTIANDVTARVFQTPAGPPLWMRGKGFNAFCPLGPAIVTRDEIPDPQNLTLRTSIDGTIVREGSTAEMLWSVAEIIACLSRHMTLLAGTVVLTGAPPPRIDGRILDGTTVRAEIEGIFSLSNSICERSAIPYHP